MRLRTERTRLATRALEVAAVEDATLRTRYDEHGLRNLLRDAEVLVDRLALCVAGDDVFWLREFADQSATVLRRRGVPMDDIVRICEAVRAGVRGILAEDEMGAADRALDAAVETYRWYRRLSGDARKRNPIIDAIYKGI